VQVLAFLSRSGAAEVAWKARHELQPRDDVRVAPMSEVETEDVPL